jgi:hypothetical protein
LNLAGDDPRDPPCLAQAVFLRENMKYLCPKVLQGMVAEQQQLIEKVQQKAAGDSMGMEEANKLRKEKDEAKENLKVALAEMG